MRIQLSGLPLEPQTFEHRGAADEYINDRDTFSGDIYIQAIIHREGNSLRLNLEAELPGQFICHRCGDSFTRTHCFKGEYFFISDEGGGLSTDREFSIIPKGAVSLDISQEIRDMILLGLPAKILCSNDCRGLCPHCGVNLNKDECACQTEVIDPRWKALQKLKNEKS